MDFTLYIRFIRKTNSSKTDDTIRIKYTGTNQFSLVYTYGDTDPSVVRTTTLKRGSLVHYLDSIFSLLQIDEAPFEFVQLDFSLMPTVLVAIKNLKTPAILNAIGLHLDQAMDEEDEYADMPGLVPAAYFHVDESHNNRRGCHEFYED